MQYTYESIRQALDAHKNQKSQVNRVTIYLTDGDNAWNPGSTKHVFWGPAEIMYEEHPDGGIAAYVDGSK